MTFTSNTISFLYSVVPLAHFTLQKHTHCLKAVGVFISTQTGFSFLCTVQNTLISLNITLACLYCYHNYIMEDDIIQQCSGITRSRVLKRELYAQRLQKEIYCIYLRTVS